MPRHQRLRGVKICAHCGGGYDGFKSMESRGRYCSPVCLAAARAARRPVLAAPAPSGGEAVTALAQ
jgi:hypothetical protein